MPSLKISQLNNYVTPKESDLLAIVDDENTETKKITVANLKTSTTGPLSKLRANSKKRVSTENINLFGGTPSVATLATLTGSGVVEEIWITMAELNHEVRLQVFVDDEIIPSFNVDISTLVLGTFGDAADFFWTTQNMHGEGGEISSQGGTLRLPIPYSDGCVIKVTSDTDVSSVYAEIDYDDTYTLPFRIKTMNRSFYNETFNVDSGSDFDLFETGTGSPGWLVFLGYAAQGSGGETYLERNFELYVDGEVTASNISSGSEDFFFGSFYFQGRSETHTPFAAVSYHGSNKVAVALDAYELNGGYYFADSLKLSLPSEAACTHDHTAGFVAIFYTPSDSAWAQPILAGSEQVPAAPIGVVAVAGNTEATVTFLTPPHDGGDAITGYTVTSDPAGGTDDDAGTTGRSHNISGLTNGTPYTFTVVATNGEGDSVDSLPSNEVTPNAGLSVVFEDTFTDSNTTNGLSSHTPDTQVSSNMWASTGGTPDYGILSNRMYCSSVGGSVESFAVYDTAEADGQLEVDIHTSSVSDSTCIGPTFRYTDVNNYLKVVLVKVSGTNRVELWKNISGSLTLLGTGSLTVADDTTYAVKVTYSGTAIEVFVDGVSKITYNTTTGRESATKVGWFMYTGLHNITGSWMDNWKVSA